MAPSSKAKVHCIECGGEYTDTCAPTLSGLAARDLDTSPANSTFSRNRHLRSAKHQNGPAEAARAAAAPFKVGCGVRSRSSSLADRFYRPQCYDCPTMKGFYKESLLKKHISKAHPAANTICGECGAEYKPCVPLNRAFVFSSAHAASQKRPLGSSPDAQAPHCRRHRQRTTCAHLGPEEDAGRARLRDQDLPDLRRHLHRVRSAARPQRGQC